MSQQKYLPDEVLLSYQKDWIADQSDLKIGEKSRRVGLTWAEAADAVLVASVEKTAGGRNHYYIGSDKDMAAEFIDACAMWARVFNKAASAIEQEVLQDENKDILIFTIRFASGLKIQALSSNPSNMRGRQGNVTIDEGAHQDKLAEVLKAALAMTMWGAKVRIISTHNGVENLFNELINDSRAGKKRYKVHRITLDDACEQGLYKRICQVQGKVWTQAAEDEWKNNLLNDTATREDALEEYYCVPKSGGGAYLSRALIESRMNPDYPVVRFEGSAEFNARSEVQRQTEIEDWCDEYLKPLLTKLNPNDQHFLGEDFGRTADLTVLAPLILMQSLRRVVPFLVELRNVPYRNQEQIFYYLADRLPRFGAAALDARGNGNYLAEQAVYKYGSKVLAVQLTQGWYLENMPPLKAAFEDDELIIPKDRDTLDDLRALQVIKGIPRLPDTKTGSNKNRHGDSAIAIAMAHFASRQEVEMFEYESVNVRRGGRDEDSAGRDIITTHGYGNMRGGAL